MTAAAHQGPVGADSLELPAARCLWWCLLLQLLRLAAAARWCRLPCLRRFLSAQSTLGGPSAERAKARDAGSVAVGPLERRVRPRRRYGPLIGASQRGTKSVCGACQACLPTSLASAAYAGAGSSCCARAANPCPVHARLGSCCWARKLRELTSVALPGPPVAGGPPFYTCRAHRRATQANHRLSV